MANLNPPFRAEHVGSLHRPKALKEARIQLLGDARQTGYYGAHANTELRALEDNYIREVVKLQEDIGLRTITDGEYRRHSWVTEFTSALDGLEMSFQVKAQQALDLRSAEREGKAAQDVKSEAPVIKVDKRIRWGKSVNVEPFSFLRSITKGVPKVTIPAPQEYFFFAGPDSIDRTVYPDLSVFWADLASAYKREVEALVKAGCTHIQFDDVVNGCLCDETHVERLLSRGEEPMKLLQTYVKCLNDALEGRPPDLRVSMHICRGNRHGHFIAEGGYDAVAEYLFNNLNIDNFYLEYDSPRAGSFAPLRFMPSNKTVVLGLITTKRPELESLDHLRTRIDEAARHVPLERLAISPQCGFSGDALSDAMGIDQMRSKLQLVVKTAEAVWGGT